MFPRLLRQPGPKLRRISFFRRVIQTSVEHASAGITGSILRPNARITVDEGVRMRSEYLVPTGGEPGGVLLQITGVGCISRETISVDGNAANITALAVLGSTR